MTGLITDMGGTGVDLQTILEELKRERGKIDQAISAIESLQTAGTMRARNGGRGRSGRRTMSAAARKRISQMMKLRWAERKRAA